MFHLLSLLDSDQQPLGFSVFFTWHIKIPGTRSQVCRVTCQQPRGACRVEQICPLCSDTRKQQCHTDPEKDVVALGRHQDTRSLLDNFIFRTSLTAHCLSVLLESRQLVQQDQANTAEVIMVVMRECRAGTTGMHAERLLLWQRHWPVFKFHLFPETENWLFMLRKAFLWEKLISH